MTWSHHDYGLSADRLKEKYQTEHPLYTREQFGEHQDYWAWVENSLQYEEYCYGEAHATEVQYD